MYPRILFLPIITASLLLAGCLDSDELLPGDQSPPAGAADLCFELRGAMDDVLAASVEGTPRPARRAEELGIVVDLELTAREGRYQRITGELGSLGSRFGELADDGHWNCPYRTESWLLRFTDEAWEAYQAGNYHEWDELNDHLRAHVSREFHSVSNAVLMETEGRYHAPTIVNAYGQLGGIRDAELNLVGFIEEVPPEMCLEVQGGDHYYVVRKQGDDCSASDCLRSGFNGMRFDADGNFERVGHWNGEGLIPRWLGRLGNCGVRFGIYD
jgi:hypothetical protein